MNRTDFILFLLSIVFSCQFVGISLFILFSFVQLFERKCMSLVHFAWPINDIIVTCSLIFKEWLFASLVIWRFHAVFHNMHGCVCCMYVVSMFFEFILCLLLMDKFSIIIIT